MLEQGNLQLDLIDREREFLNFWLAQKSPSSRQIYANIAQAFFQFCAKGIRQITPYDIQNYVQSLERLSTNTIRLHVSVLKSMFSMAMRLGYIEKNPSLAVRTPKASDTISERIITEAEVLLLIKKERNSRNRALLSFLYLTGARAQEVEDLTWANIHDSGDGVVVTIHGKGGKTRNVRIESHQWKKLGLERGPDEAPLFLSQKGNKLDRTQIFRIVRKAGERIGLKISPHWLRHAHASHAIDHGAPISLVQATLAHSSLNTTGKYLHARPRESSAKYLII